ncbi:hypothetical protein GVN16_23920 [Emticicia sp. CRIBPO]|uniref:hypothetical protein n=1 Tax=Emticicia sp. CRIBPO TaxID=2683258 RepID=UPI001412BD45|nr:hypothetical protein [Emticicia sp. CRIBPO]NBA88844.1 hypothetical protein [Emticicia sp. CRIBPO]
MALISKKKVPYKISPQLRDYLVKYGREKELPIKYSDLHRFDNRITLYDKKGNDTLWETVFYQQSDLLEIYENLKRIYADLKTDGDESVIKHLIVDRVDICTYANTSPFRIRISNKVNDNYDYFYIKNADASRVYGLELEHILSPNVISYVTNKETLVEEHIAGITGDLFIQNHLTDVNLNPIRLSKEFIKFNERCFVRLLGDMHSSNFVIIVTPDFEDFHYRIRAIDFDQQSYEASKSVYMPQYFKQNNAIIEVGMKYMTPESVKQYQIEERSLISNRMLAEKTRLQELIESMKNDRIFLPQNLVQLKEELSLHYKNKDFLKCKNMGDVVELSLNLVNMH